MNVTDQKIADVRMKSFEERKHALSKQLEIEIKIKAGAENMLLTFSQGPKKDKKLCDEATSMLKDAKLKIEYIKMQMNKLNNMLNEGISSPFLSVTNRTEENICNLYKFFYKFKNFLS